MFKVEYKIGKFAGQTKEYTTAGRSARHIFNNLYTKGHELPAKITAWMESVDGSNKPHNLTVGELIRIEYTPNKQQGL